ncbi:MAG TPA: sugar transferase [Armatimonadaceae bacterium]|nr:sugar transferase [Armatimonadaceae bacterium]
MAWMDEPRREPFAESAVAAEGDMALINRRPAAGGAGGISVLERPAVAAVTAVTMRSSDNAALAAPTASSSGATTASAAVAGHISPAPEEARGGETSAAGQWERLPGFLLRSARSTPGVGYIVAKRALDVLVAGGLMVLLFPLLLLVGIAIVVEDRGPMLYYQTRVGRNGRHFRFYKFRSMVRNADALKAQLAAKNESDGPAFKMKNDPRVTRIGRILRRYSIDELPQLLNVLKGEMSLVGPRPHLPSEVAQYTGRQADRLAVQPGLLCLREVLGRSNVSFEQWVEWDLLYTEHRSLRTDMWILLRTLPAVFMADGAY